MSEKRILVTAALPYANGPIHLGHLVEYIQTDIWVRFQKLRGRRCVFICADDTHGTAITIRARKEGRSEEALIADMREQHLRDFTSFGVAFDNYGSTNSLENRVLCHTFWKALRGAGLVVQKDVSQLYDTTANTFLADRFVKGTCPNCKEPNQYGDNCEKCNAVYSPHDLIDPVSTLSGTKPEVRTTPHLFVELEKLHGFLEDWTQNGQAVQTEVANYLKGQFLGKPLRDWDVSRPGPYFGFEIPDAPGNSWYVWFDAPIGYIASTHEWCKRNGEQLDDWWKSSETEVHHFIGRDITYFHTLFWPGMLKTAGYNLPERVHIHGFLNVNGEKMSKRKGTFVMAATYLKHLDPAYLRYYYASKLGPRWDDLDLSPEEFVNKINSDLVGKVVNLASRTAKFAEKTGLSATYPEDGGLFASAAAQGEAIAAAYREGDSGRAMRLIMELADRANPYVDQNAPWLLAKDPNNAQRVQDVCTVALNLFRQIVVYLAPVLPRLAEQTGKLLGQPIQHWDEAKRPLVGTPVAKFEHMLKRVELKDFQNMIEESKIPDAADSATAAAPQWSDSDASLLAEPLAAQITIEDFQKIDLRVARIIAADDVPDAKKLLKFTLSLGGNERRTVFAGIKQAYDPKKLLGRLVIMVANLQPRQMKFGLSEGMIVATGPGGAEVFLLGVDEGGLPGQRVH